MTLENNNEVLDKISWQILMILQENSRLSFAEIGRKVGLSAPAVADRVKKMEEAEIIRGYTTEINYEKIGLPITAYMRIQSPGNINNKILDLVKKLPEVLECYRVTGAESIVMRVVASSIHHLEKIIDKFSPYGHTTTSIVLSSYIEESIITPNTVKPD